MSKQRFNKKVYTFSLFFNDIFFLISKIGEFNKLKKNTEINEVFREKIMTVCSAVNGCVYCKWFHAKQSIKSGIPANEVKELLNLQFGTAVSDFELTGVLFSQHYAETNRKPDDMMLQKLYTEYGEKNANHIILSIRMIFFGNLYGNTLDAFISRLNGKKAENSSLFFEFWFFITNLPVYIYLNFITDNK